ncbi:PilZ domain-containing protein [Nitrospira calida]|jgi:hypothetical protein
MILRKEQRFPVSFHAVLTSIKAHEHAGMVLDLSSSGCRVNSRLSVFTGMQLGLRLHLPGQDPPIRVDRGTVRWCRGEEFGVQFTEITSHENSRLRAAVQALKNSLRT